MGTLAFNIWIAQFRPVILADPAIQVNPVEFAQRLLSVKRDPQTWLAFVDQWRMTRILFDDDFGIVFKAVKQGLRIPVDESVPASVPAAARENVAENEQSREEEKKSEL